MKIIDMHNHIRSSTPKTERDAERLLERLDSCGVFASSVFSNFSPAYSKLGQEGFSRLDDVLNMCKDHRDRLYPFLIIHPDEENSMELIKSAVDRGICGFKMLCNNFFVYEEKSMKLIRYIAKLGKPIIFHSGILWDGNYSSQYNRPTNWEALLDVENLKFSMGHCSWPWIDECIAVYGKFLNSYTKGKSTEMFFDITPGTPEIYRKELLTKLYGIGYDVRDNIMFGSDGNADNYNGEWTKKWLDIDGKIFEGLGLNEELLQKVYSDNFLRFIGERKKDFIHNSPTTDNSNSYGVSAKRESDLVIDFARGEYERQGLDAFYGKSFIDVFDGALEEAYGFYQKDEIEWSGKPLVDLLIALMRGYKLKEKYSERGIDDKILYDTLTDIGVWARTYFSYSSKIGLEETNWIKRHLSFSIFKLGRLQFEIAFSKNEASETDTAEPVINVHIPEGGRLEAEHCKDSIEQAREFFKKYFPEHNYSCFTCHSWLLDKEVENLLGKESNIAKFAGMFTPIKSEESYAVLKYVFRWDVKEKEMLNGFVPKTKLQSAIISHIENGGKFYETEGIIKK